MLIQFMFVTCRRSLFGTNFFHSKYVITLKSFWEVHQKKKQGKIKNTISDLSLDIKVHVHP